MNKQHDLAEVNQDGELSEDSLYTWNGNAWVPIEHEPYSGGGLSWWTPDKRRTFNAQRDAENEKADRMVEFIIRAIAFIPNGLLMLFAIDVYDRRVPKYDDTGNVGFLGIVLAIVLIIFIAGLFLWICFGTLG